MTDSKIIEEDLYKKICSEMPIPCVDIIFQNKDGHFLSLKRNNEPLKSEFWLPGGRILKEETVEYALCRKSKEELDLIIDPEEFKFAGFSEAHYEKNAFGTDGGYHTISLVFMCIRAIDESDIKLDSQSSEFKFSSRLPDEFLESFQETPTSYIYK